MSIQKSDQINQRRGGDKLASAYSQRYGNPVFYETPVETQCPVCRSVIFMTDAWKHMSYEHRITGPNAACCICKAAMWTQGGSSGDSCTKCRGDGIPIAFDRYVRITYDDDSSDEVPDLTSS